MTTTSGWSSPDQPHRVAAVTGLGDHRHPGVFERAPDRLSQELMIVGEQNPHHTSLSARAP